MELKFSIADFLVSEIRRSPSVCVPYEGDARCLSSCPHGETSSRGNSRCFLDKNERAERLSSRRLLLAIARKSETSRVVYVASYRPLHVSLFIALPSSVVRHPKRPRPAEKKRGRESQGRAGRGVGEGEQWIANESFRSGLYFLLRFLILRATRCRPDGRGRAASELRSFLLPLPRPPSVGFFPPFLVLSFSFPFFSFSFYPFSRRLPSFSVAFACRVSLWRDRSLSLFLSAERSPRIKYSLALYLHAYVQLGA